MGLPGEKGHRCFCALEGYPLGVKVDRGPRPARRVPVRLAKHVLHFVEVSVGGELVMGGADPLFQFCNRLKMEEEKKSVKSEKEKLKIQRCVFASKKPGRGSVGACEIAYSVLLFQTGCHRLCVCAFRPLVFQRLPHGVCVCAKPLQLRVVSSYLLIVGLKGEKNMSVTHQGPCPCSRLW